ncbi:MAG: DUF6449 domain-containing protein [Lachnospiraceae bacterium]|nr:DUF6449 domain-containing protein [Lachnospiraceae bacterium]
MTSKSLFFKLMKEDLKRKIWAVGLAFLSFFFWMPVSAAMNTSSLLKRYERWIAEGATFGDGITAAIKFEEQLRDIVSETVGMANVMNATTIAVAAIVMALTGFMYLHSKKQMDFYHSVPVRREVLFAVRYLNGILIVAVCYLINLMFACGVLMINGADTSLIIHEAVTATAAHFAGYLVNYGLMTIAVILTGNFFISILGGIVLFAWIPAVTALAEGLMSMFFATVNMRESNILSIMTHGSPISWYVILLSDAAGNRVNAAEIFRSAGVGVLVGIIMAAVAVVLYRLRPSESAGKAMAFKVTKAPIKILLVVPITIFMTVLFWNIYYSIPWAVFGFVFGLVITHCLVEIIYHFEFRKLFSNLPQMGICAVLSLVIIASFRFDLFGYDRYLPKESEFESASVFPMSLNDWTEYGLPVKMETGYRWSYMQGDDYVAGNMKVTDYDLIVCLAKEGIERSEVEKAQKYANNWAYNSEEDGFYTYMEVGYHLKNGKTVYRSYHVNITNVRESFDRLYESEEYKNGIYPVLTFSVDDVTGIYLTNRSEIRKVSDNRSVMEEILLAYQEEMRALTLKERFEETPVAGLRFLTTAEYGYLASITRSRAENYNGDFRIEDMNQVNFFPVYPGFKKTLALLEEAGIRNLGTPDAGEVERIEISCDYEEEWDQYETDSVSGIREIAATYSLDSSFRRSGNTIILENDGTPEMLSKISEVLDCTGEQDMVNMNGLQTMARNISVRVFFKDVNEGKPVSEQSFTMYMFLKDEIPDFVKEAFRIEK